MINRWIVSGAIVALLGVGGCVGVPLGSIPKLRNLQSAIVSGEPAELILAVQVDRRLVPPAGEVPKLVLKLTPRDPQAFAPIDRALPMSLIVSKGDFTGLPNPQSGRRWLVYQLTPESVREVKAIRALIQQYRSDPQGRKGGALAVGIEQTGLAVKDPAFAQSPWETWVQPARSEGFFKLWSGTTTDLLRQGAR